MASPTMRCLVMLLTVAFLPVVWLAQPVLAETTSQQLDFANGLFHRGFYAEAMDEYAKFLALQPEGDEAVLAWLRLGRCAIAVQDYEKAVEAFLKAEAQSKDHDQQLEARVSAAEAQFFKNAYTQTLAITQTLIGDDVPDSIRAKALYYHGRTLFETGNAEGAETAFATLVQEIPTSVLVPFAWYHLGFVRLAKNNDEGAAQAFTNAANASEADPTLRMESRFRAAELYDKLGWTEAALGAYERLRSEFPDSDYARRAEYGYCWALFHTGRYEEAFAHAETVNKQELNVLLRAGLLYLMGNCRYQQARYAEALALYKSLQEHFPDSPFATRAFYKSAYAYHLAGDSSSAKDTATKFIQCCSNSEFAGEVHYLLGILLTAEGNYEEGLAEFRIVAEQYSNSEFAAEALFKSGECLAQLGLREEAAKTFEKFSQTYPNHPFREQALLRAGDARFTDQNFVAALPNYQAVTEKPITPSAQEEALYRTAVTFHNLKNRGESATAFRRLLEKFPNSKYAAEAWFRIAEFEQQESKDSLQAIEAYEKALQNNPPPSIRVNILQGIAMARYEQKDFEQATKHILLLITEYPDVSLPAEAYLWCGQWLGEQKQYSEAATVFKAMLNAYPEYPQRVQVYYLLGKCSENIGNAKEAIEAYSQALATAGGTQLVEIHYRLGALHQSLGALATAQQHYESAASLDGGETSAKARFDLAALLESMGDYENAARNYMRLAILFVHETLSPESLWRAGNCYLHLNNTAQAESIFRELIMDYPESSFAEEAKSRLASINPTTSQTQ